MSKMKTTAEERAMLRDTSVFGVWDESALTVRVIDDIDTLLVERKSLLAENERLRAAEVEVERYEAAYLLLCTEFASLWWTTSDMMSVGLAECERLRGQNAAAIESWRVGVQVAQDILDTRASGYDDE